MALGEAVIRKSVSNGPYIYEWEIGGEVTNAAVDKTGVQAIDEVVVLAKALPGTIQKIYIRVDSS
jgi:hypothetical protein